MPAPNKSLIRDKPPTEPKAPARGEPHPTFKVVWRREPPKPARKLPAKLHEQDDTI